MSSHHKDCIDEEASNSIRINKNAEPVAEKNKLSERKIKILKYQGFTRGLSNSIFISKEAFPIRFWLIDNSGSMNVKDGNRLHVVDYKNVELLPCTRWDEICDCVNYHVRLAETIQARTIFRLINTPDKVARQFETGLSRYRNKLTKIDHLGAKGGLRVQSLTAVESDSLFSKIKPKGPTPLAQCIREVKEDVERISSDLCRNNDRVSVTIATDGLPTDDERYSGVKQKREFVESLQSLNGLPISVIVRLCTDDEEVVMFYNEILNAGILDFSIEVLDDFISEAEEVEKCNPWLNYSLPIHRLREMGFPLSEMNDLDDRLLSKHEIINFCKLLFGHGGGSENDEIINCLDPDVDWGSCKKWIENCLKNEDLIWNPIDKKNKKWIDIKKLNKLYLEKRRFGKNK